MARTVRAASVRAQRRCADERSPVPSLAGSRHGSCGRAQDQPGTLAEAPRGVCRAAAPDRFGRTYRERGRMAGRPDTALALAATGRAAGCAISVADHLHETL